MRYSQNIGVLNRHLPMVAITCSLVQRVRRGLWVRFYMLPLSGRGSFPRERDCTIFIFFAKMQKYLVENKNGTCCVGPAGRTKPSDSKPTVVIFVLPLVDG